MEMHKLKVNYKNGAKYEKETSWSIRLNDRDFKVGDLCLFKRIPSEGTALILKEITKITEFPEGLKYGYVILDLRLIKMYWEENA